MDIICNPDASDHETSLWLEISMISEYVPGISPLLSIYGNYITLNCDDEFEFGSHKCTYSHSTETEPNQFRQTKHIHISV